jgi:4a-hydroxytetrahydrobiopterin dehydratase
MSDRQRLPCLGPDAIRAALAERAPAWRVHDGALVREYRFADFATAFAFMGEVAAAAELHNHHPDWRNRYARVEIAWRTHDSGGITDLDVAMAQRCDAVTERFAQRPDATK